MSIPKHIEEKIQELSKSESASIQFLSAQAIELGYSLAMEELKPILEAAREVINGAPELTQELDILIYLLKQYDEQHK